MRPIITNILLSIFNCSLCTLDMVSQRFVNQHFIESMQTLAMYTNTYTYTLHKPKCNGAIDLIHLVHLHCDNVFSLQRKQLLDLGVLQTFIRLAFEDDRSTSSRYPYSELTKLYSLVSILIRSCDVSKSMKSSLDVSQNLLPMDVNCKGIWYFSNVL